MLQRTAKICLRLQMDVRGGEYDAMYDIQLIKSRVNCVDYAQRMGLPIRQSGDRCTSPLRTDAKNPTSFVVLDEFYYDFSAGMGGDVIELCATLAHNGDRGAAIRDLATLTGVTAEGVESSEEWKDYTNQLNARTAYYHSQLTENDRSYLHSRGLTDENIDELLIGRVTDGPLKGRLFLPYFHPNGYCCYYATRAMPGGAFPDSKYMKQKKDDYCQHIPWGLQTLNRESDTLVIAEGYFDCISFACAGYPVLSAITGIFSKHQLSTVLAAARNFKRVFIVYDDDSKTSNAGEKFTHRMSEILTRNRIPFIVGTVPTPYHDISEYYAAGGDLSRIISSAEPGIEYIASRITDFSDLESYVYTVARHTKRTALDNLFSRLRELRRWDGDALKSLFKSATTAPPETIVADEILREHQLLYIHAVGFYEYTGGVWQRLNDGIIGGYADRAYGEFSTSQRVSAIVKLLKIRALRDVVFDRQPVWNFVNGTLELDTGVFRDHNPNDYCSVQSSYPYNPDATYNSWASFIDDVTAGDPKSAELLQFIPGYALGYQDNRLERIFVLQGLGSNGKSVYLDMLRQLFGDTHVSHLQPRALLDRFQVIQLRESIINIAGEIRSDFKDVEERMKSIATGEPISGCYKSQDFVTFIPRTKLVFATNTEITSGDTSEGLARRLVIVDFKVSFVDYPDPNDPYQRPKNVDIKDELARELASGGIFNWVYEGYKLLRTVGYFTETNDQVELIQDFRRSSNPVLQFYEEKIVPDYPVELLNQQLYEDYKSWCIRNTYDVRSSNSFYREFKKVAKLRYEPFRTATQRGYRLKIRQDEQ